MAGFRQLVSEIHRRSLWQVLGVYLVGGWVVYQVVWTLIESLGLPAWLAPATVVLLLAELPVVMAAAIVHEGPPGTNDRAAPAAEPAAEPTLASDAPAGAADGSAHPAGEPAEPHPAARHLTWRRAILAGLIGFALLGAGGIGYMGMRVAGIGPAGTLIARGVVENQARLIVADLDSPPEDTLTARALSEALRIDLATSPVVRVVQLEEIAPVLELMQLPRGTPLTEPIARQAALREGVPVVLTGELVPVGRAYQLTAKLVDPEEDSVFLTLREEAHGENELLKAANRLSGRLRERIGESLRTVQNRTPLYRHTTGSLEALELVIEADRAANIERDHRRAVELLEKAVALDSMYAMAWRKLGVVLGNAGWDRARMVDALTRAYRLVDRLRPGEQIMTRGSYFQAADVDYDRAAEVYRRGLEEYPEVLSYWWNMGVALMSSGHTQESLEAMVRSTELNPVVANVRNAILYAVAAHDLETAQRQLDILRREFPDVDPRRWDAYLAYHAGDTDEARSILEALEAEDTDDMRWVVGALAWLDAREGRLRSAEAHCGQASDRALRDRDTLGAYTRALDCVQTRPMVGGRTADTRARVLELLTRTAFDGIPDIDHPYLREAYLLALHGLPDQAMERLAAWEKVMPEGLRPATRDLELVARGEIAFARGDGDAGLDLFREAVRYRRGARPFFAGLLAQAYDRLQMADSALVAHHRYLDAPDWDRWRSDSFFLARTYERLGQLHEECGDLEEAAHYYGLFVDLWQDADAELQPRVAAARLALERLTSESD